MRKRTSGMAWAVAAALWACSVGVLQAAEAVAKPAQAQAVLPEGVLGVVEIADGRQLKKNLEAFVTAVTGNAVNPLGAGNDLAGLGLDQIDFARPAQLLLVPAGEGSCGFVAVFRPTTVQGFLDFMGKRFAAKGQEGNLYIFTQTRQHFDGAAFQAAAPADRGDPQKFMKAEELPVVVGVEGAAACAGRDKAAVGAGLALLKAGVITDRPLLPGGDDVAARFEVKAIMERFGGPAGAFAGLRKTIQGSAVPGDPNLKPEQVKAMWLAYVDMVEEMAAQVKAVRGGLRLSGESINFSAELEALPGTPMAAYLASVPKGQADVLKYVPDDVFAVGALRIGDLKQIAPAWAKAGERVMAAMGAGPEAAKQYADACTAFLQTSTDQYAFGMRPGLPVHFTCAVRFADAAAGRQAMSDMGLAMNALYEKAAMPVKVKLTESTYAYKGHAAAKWVMSMEFPDVAGAKGPTAAEPMRQMQRQFLSAVLGGNELAMHGISLANDWHFESGLTDDEAAQRFDAILDRTQEKLVDDPAFVKALASMPPDASGVFFCRLTGLSEWQVAMLRAAMPAMAGMMPSPKFKPGPGMWASVRNEGTRAMLSCTVPAAEVRVVVDGWKEAFQRVQAQAGMGAQPQKSPKQPRDQVEVQVTADGSIRLAGQQMTLKDADAKFDELAKRDPPVELIVRSDPTVPYEKIKDVMDAAKAAGIKRMRQETAVGGTK